MHFTDDFCAERGWTNVRARAMLTTRPPPADPPELGLEGTGSIIVLVATGAPLLPHRHSLTARKEYRAGGV